MKQKRLSISDYKGAIRADVYNRYLVIYDNKKYILKSWLMISLAKTIVDNRIWNEKQAYLALKNAIKSEFLKLKECIKNDRKKN